jgi:hypothetical protein
MCGMLPYIKFYYMQTPFTDFTGIQRELNDTMELPFQNPLVDPLKLQKENNMSNDWNRYHHESVYGPVMEAELSDTEVTTAVNMNASEMTALKWKEHLPAISEKLKVITGIDPKGNFQRDLQNDVLAKAIDRYQEMKGIKPHVKGAMSIETWSAMQDELGFLKYDKFKKIDLVKATKANEIYKKNYWGNHVGFIIKLFKYNGLMNYEYQLDDKYFAIMVAQWQTLNDILKNNPKNSDGILGPVSWDVMRTEIESKFPAYEIKAHIKVEDTAEAARRFVEVMRNFAVMLVNSLDAIENKIDASLRNEKQESSLVREGVYLVADTIMDVISETELGAIPAAVGKITLGLFKKYFEEKEENLRRQSNIIISHTLSDIVLVIKNTVTLPDDKTVVQHRLEDILNHSGFDKKTRSEEFTKFLNLLVQFEETIRNTDKVYRIALSKLMNAISIHTRVIVHSQNTKDIDDWTESDLKNISTDPDRKKLFLRFSRIHQYVNADSDNLTSNQRKILRVLWELWNERNYALKQMLLDKHVVFRVHLMEAVVGWMKAPVPYDVYIKTLNKGQESWINTDDILGRTGSAIHFYSWGKFQTKQMEQRNSNGLTYKYIILSIVNSVMSNEFNNDYNSRQVGFVEKESEEVVSGNYDSPDIVRNEMTEIDQETLPVIFPKQTSLAAPILSVTGNTKATSANKFGFQRSGLQLALVVSALGKYIDISAVRQSLSSYNQKEPGQGYVIDTTSVTIDSVFTEAVHQFQVSVFIDTKQHDGILGRSTLESLGFLDHGLKQKLDSRMFYGQGQLNRRDVKDEISKQTGKYTASNWFQFILKPSWLGVPISSGVHSLLLEKLREAESWLLNQPQYKNMTPAALGRALGFKADSVFSAARLSSDNQAMHGFGLAIDINVDGNPWIGAGWIVNNQVLLQERYRMITALRKASGNNSLPGDTIFAYLHSIAQSAGDDTSKAYSILKQRNDEFVAYLRTNSQEHNYWKQSVTFGGREPLNGFLNLHPGLVYALRQVAGLAWGAMDFGPRASGDIMHFDMRTQGVGKFICGKIGGYVPTSGHPSVQNKTGLEKFVYEGEDDSKETESIYPVHEAIGEALDKNEDGAYSSNEDEQWNPQYEEDFEDNSVYEDQYVSSDFEDAKDWSHAVRLNNRYASQLGWNNYIVQINQLLLPFSGAQDVSLEEDAFAKAVAGWQKNRGFSDSDSDGILGPHTWTVMKSLIVPSNIPSAPVIITGSSTPDVSNIAAFNTWHAQKILDNMNTGTIGENFGSKAQLEALARGELVMNVDPQRRIVQILPVMQHISNLAQENNYNDIIFGSFIRKPDNNGSCSGHCAGTCIDINYKKGNFETNGSVEMVSTILRYLTTLPSIYKKRLGFGMPLQGQFFGRNPYAKFKYQPASNLINSDLQVLVPKIGFAFPDNDNHLHIQVSWV